MTMPRLSHDKSSPSGAESSDHPPRSAEPEIAPTPEQVIFGYLLQNSSLRKHLGREHLHTMSLEMTVHLRKYGYTVVSLHHETAAD